MSRTGRAATIKDVAVKAGTSIATVSYVFSNAKRYIRPELRERVLAAAAGIGYVKNAAASSIRGKRRGVLAVVVAQFSNTFFARMCVEIVSIARREGYVVMLCNSDEDPHQESTILERLVAQRIDGCILSPATSSEGSTELLQRHGIPHVILERAFPVPAVHQNFVGHDNAQSGYLATKHLLEAGHRRVAYLGWDSPIPNVCERVDGYRSALREYGVPADLEVVVTEELSEAAGRRMAAKLSDEVTAVVLGHHDIAKGALQYLQDQGIHWPDDLSLVMIGTPEWAGVLRPRLTCIQRPEHQMGVAAAALLLENIKNPKMLPNQQIFTSSVIEGNSVLGRRRSQ
jgi:DNA-binding LacI/PurR family transcriptional regulator